MVRDLKAQRNPALPGARLLGITSSSTLHAPLLPLPNFENCSASNTPRCKRHRNCIQTHILKMV